MQRKKTKHSVSTGTQQYTTQHNNTVCTVVHVQLLCKSHRAAAYRALQSCFPLYSIIIARRHGQRDIVLPIRYVRLSNAGTVSKQVDISSHFFESPVSLRPSGTKIIAAAGFFKTMTCTKYGNPRP